MKTSINAAFGAAATVLLLFALAVTAPTSASAQDCVPDDETCCWPPEDPFDYMGEVGSCYHTDCPGTEDRKCVNDNTPYAWFTNCYLTCWPGEEGR